MIEVNNVTKRFVKSIKKGRRLVKEEFEAVNQISLKTVEGEVLGILGPNGAGKTTLLRMLGGILTPTEGEIKMNDRVYANNRNVVKKEIGYLSGNTKLYGRVTPRELLSTFGELYELPKEVIEQRIEEIFAMFNMHSFGDNRIEYLSTGQTQRVSIARCLIHSPKVYIFDEPTLGLDVLSSETIIRFMKEEKEKGKSVIYSTHYMEEAEYLCDRILMMHEGKVLYYGTKDEIKQWTQTTNLRDAFLTGVKAQGGNL